jgi:glutamine synthetase
MVLYTLLKTGTEGPLTEGVRQTESYLPDNIYTAIDNFRASAYVKDLYGADVAERYAELKQASADRCPRLLGTRIKTGEIQFHHEVYNQSLWNQF